MAPTEFRLELVKPLFDTDENRHNPLSLSPPVAPGTADNAKGITTNYSVLNIHGRTDAEAEIPILWPPDVKN